MKNVVFYTTLFNYGHSKTRTDAEYLEELQMNELLAVVHSTLHDMKIVDAITYTLDNKSRKEVIAAIKKIPRKCTVLIPIKEVVAADVEIMQEFIKKNVKFHIITEMDSTDTLAREVKAETLQNEILFLGLKSLLSKLA